MREWTILLGGLVIWAAHFFVLYGIASVLPGKPAATGLVLVATLVAAPAAGVILWRAIAGLRKPDPLDRWMAQVGAVGAALSLVAVIWQAVPAI